MSRKTLLTSKEIEIILHRLACQLIENHTDFSNTVLIGLQPRGTYLANRLATLLTDEYQIKNLQLGFLDITFYRDDFRRRNEPLEATSTNIDFLIEGKKVVLIDDVLYSGRSVRSALTALESYGRPENIELLVLIDRRFSRHLPIQPNYRGRQVDAINQEKVVVNWLENYKEDTIYIETKPTKLV
ncbi:bifunctional pyr operon transcriptional regulator/uracil phosphoribosyltransferase PyrR [Tenacibaculum piscium]|uniref:Bifunctional protein PyrR n=1 Tax=Tenacibaculum piscium TaxID=1458515 RepID=A0A2H1YES1_9FLAO|nr:bifunctional pyr operon transcriptional regulator/uracil phosphoribosyltransferase PyrR [Tenacibaculum piscium]MBE7628845.1 bifunctional pyr operon transcriptional regulator/uracil phosphoribosyltransferase PyrR [Tenacibaculum piscium]MBE7671148.1 bifunctional pyr operon transcriptional regulator/uracil phosphoribosyltransferase PyrR [Tenacibaculum piscium]MBE7685133.1 bifunctional pyr operon transcriptional regulator/uracil phosphoribosyltransferase PyrR [Tenacibaculum piscium]MBE7689836.1 